MANRKMGTKKAQKVNDKIIVDAICLLAGCGVSLFAAIATKYYLKPIFWAGLSIELVLAYLVHRMNEYNWLRLLISAVALLAPFLLSYPNVTGHYSNTLEPIRYSLFFFLTFYGVFVTIDDLRGKAPPEESSENLDFQVVVPDLPGDFGEEDRNFYRYKKHWVADITWKNSKSNVLWLKESNGEIPNIEPRKNMQFIEKKIKDVPIRIEVEVLKPNSKRARKGEPPFIEANWSRKGLNFNLRSDGLTLDEVEKAIASMMLEPLK
jgi:hypothetical protein